MQKSVLLQKKTGCLTSVTRWLPEYPAGEIP